jgi:streptogramin lyase
MRLHRFRSHAVWGLSAAIVLSSAVLDVRLPAQGAGPAAQSSGATEPAVESHGPTPTPALLVGEKSGARLAIVDPDTLGIVARVPVGNGPHEVAASGRYAYVSNSGSAAVTVVDVLAQSRLPSIDTAPFGSLHGLTTAAGKLYISHEGTRIITRYNPETRAMEWAYGTGMGSHLILVSPDERTIYLASGNGQRFGIMEQSAGRGGGGGGGARGGGRGGANWTFTTFPSGSRMEGMDITPDGREFWVLDMNENKVVIVNIADKTIAGSFTLPTKFTNRVRFSVDGRYAFFNELEGPELFVFDAVTRREIKRIPVGAGGEGIFPDPRGGRVYYAVSRGNKLAAIDVNTLTVASEVGGLENPDGMAWYGAEVNP